MVRLTDRPDMTIAVYRGRKTTTQQQQYFSGWFDIKEIWKRKRILHSHMLVTPDDGLGKVKNTVNNVISSSFST